jgi:hypothetical protein
MHSASSKQLSLLPCRLLSKETYYCQKRPTTVLSSSLCFRVALRTAFCVGALVCICSRVVELVELNYLQ